MPDRNQEARVVDVPEECWLKLAAGLAWRLRAGAYLSLPRASRGGDRWRSRVGR